MAIFDYLTNMTADYTSETLSVACQTEIEHIPKKNQADHEFYDGSINTVNLSDTVYFDGYLQWPKGISAADAGTVMDFYANSSKADFKRKSIYWEHPTDGHTYVIKFRGPIKYKYVAGLPGYIQIPQVPIRIIGRKAE